MAEGAVSIAESIQAIRVADPLEVIGSVGVPGVGKDAAAQQAAEAEGWLYWSRYLPLMEAVEINGCPAVSHETKLATWYPFEGVFPLQRDADKYDGKTILVVLSDIGQATGPVAKAGIRVGYGDGDKRFVGMHELYHNTRVMFTSNLHTHRAGSHRFETYFTDRVTLLEAEPGFVSVGGTQIPEWCFWANAHNIHPSVVGFVAWTKVVTDFAPDKDKFMSPRGLVGLSRWLYRLEAANVDGRIRRAVTIGRIGPEKGTEFLAYHALAKDLPDMDAVLAGKRVALPERVEVQYMFASALLRAAREEHVAAVANLIMALTDSGATGLEVAAFIVLECLKGSAVKLRGIAGQQELYKWLSKYGKYLP